MQLSRLAPALAAVTLGLAACAGQTAATPTPAAEPPLLASSADPVAPGSEQAGSADANPWPDAPSHWGRWTMRIRPDTSWRVASSEGPVLVLDATLLTDDANVILAGEPRAHIVRPGRDAEGRVLNLLDSDTWSRLMPARESEPTHGAYVHLPIDPADRRPVDVEMRCRIMRVFVWATYEFAPLELGRDVELAAAPYTLDITCAADSIYVYATAPRNLNHTDAAAIGVSGVLPHIWAARSVEVRDAAGTLLVSRGEMGSHWGSSVTYGNERRGQATPIQYPVTVQLRVPRKFELQYPTFEWKGLTLPPTEGDVASR